MAPRYSEAKSSQGRARSTRETGRGGTAALLVSFSTYDHDLAMLRLRVTYESAADLRRALDQEVARGVVLVKITPPDGLQFRDPIRLELTSPGGALEVNTEVVSILPGVGVVVAFPPDRVPEARALLAAPPENAGPDEAPPEPAPATPAPAATARAPVPMERASTAEKIQLALHGSRDDRAAILRDQNRTLHAYVLKSPQVTIDEVTAWAKNPQMSVEFLKLIAERKEWLSRPAIALALARNPKIPPEIGLRALDYAPSEAIRQMAKGVGAPPHIVQAARKKILGK